MYNFEFAKDGCGVVREDHLLQVVDDELVATVRAKRSLYSACYGSAGVNVANDCPILGIVASALSAIASEH